MPTTTELLDLDGIGLRAESVRFDILDETLTVTGTIRPASDEPARIVNDVDRVLKRTLEGLRLAPADAAAVDTVADRVRPVWVLENGATFNCGVFLFADASRAVISYGNPMEATLVDRLFILDQAVEESVGVDEGTNIGTEIAALAEAAGITDTSGVDGTARTVGEPIAWPAGTRRLAIMDELAGMAGFHTGYFDNDGLLIYRAVPDLDAATPDFVYGPGEDLEGTKPGTVVAGSIIESDDLLEAPNRYIVIDNSPIEGALVGSADIPDAAPHSIANRGFVVARVIDVQGLENTDAADAKAEALIAEDSSTYRWISFAAAADPRHDTFDIVEWDGANYREQAWDLELAAGGAMLHDMRRIY